MIVQKLGQCDAGGTAVIPPSSPVAAQFAGDTYAPALSILHQPVSLGPAEDLDFGLALLARARQGDLGPTVRFYRPEPTLAFGQRDTNLAGFSEACAAARRHGFAPLIRKAGGRAAAYHRGCLVIDHIEPQPDAMVRAKTRFRHFGELLASALRSVGVDAGVGQVRGEYCPGEFSVHGTGTGGAQVKLIGTAQRVVSGAWLFSSVIVVEGSAPLRAVLNECYAALGLDWTTETAGGAADLVPGLTVEAVETAVVRAYARNATLTEQDWSTLET